MIKVLQLCPGLGTGGISSVIINYYRLMNKEEFVFDYGIFLPEIGVNGQVAQSYNSQINILPQKKQGLLAYCKALSKLIKDNNYDVVHAHQNYMSFIPLAIAKICGVKIRIAHAHTSAEVESGFLHKIYARLGRILTKMFATDLVACGKEAGKFSFGKKTFNKQKVFVLPNAINIDKFKFDATIADELKNELNLSNNFIVGSVGRLSKEKNIGFIIDCMADIVKKHKEIIYVVLGDGDYKDRLLNQIHNLNLDKNVLLLGTKSNINHYYNMFNLLVMPSLSEGFPVACVEGIANGLPILLSDTITNEFDDYQMVNYLPLEKERWENKILRQYNQYKYSPQRIDHSKQLNDDNLNIATAYKQLENLYKKKEL